MADEGAPRVLGRDSELAAIEHALADGLDNTPRFLLLVGEAGIGETTLLRAAAAIGADRGLRVLTGTCARACEGMAYLPLLAPLEICLADGDGPAAAEVGRLVRGADGQPTGDDGTAGAAARLVEAVFALLTSQPTLLTIDDVHWSDASTVAVLDYVSQRARAEPLVVVATARDDEPERLARLPIADGRRFQRLPLERLSREQVAQKLQLLLGAAVDDGRLGEVYQRSDGNPMFVEELVSSGPTETPASLQALVLQRAVDLEPDARAVVDALAVIGRPAEESLVGAVAQLPEAPCAAALADAVRHGVAAGDGGIGFRHPLFGEVIVSALSPSARNALHRRTAESLTARGADPAEVARHWRAAGDREQARSASLAAAAAAERQLAFAETRLHLEHALDEWPEIVEGRSIVLERAARAAWMGGEAGVAVAHVRAALRAGGPETPELQIDLAQYAWDAGEREASTSAFERAVQLVQDDTAPETRVLALWGLSRVHIAQGRYAAGIAVADEALAPAEAIGEPALVARVLMLRAMAFGFAGRLDGVESAHRGLDLARRAGDPEQFSHAYQFLTDLLHLAGDLHQAVAVATEGIEEAERAGLARWHGSDLRGRAALVLLELGRWREAAEILERAEARAFPSLARALLAARTGAFEAAEQELERAATGGAIGGPGSLGGELELAIAEVAWLRGDLRGARTALTEIPDVPGVWGLAIRAKQRWWAARLDTEPDGAGVAEHPDPRLRSALVAEVGAELAGDADAPTAWAAAVALWETAERPYDLAVARYRQAASLVASGARDEAGTALRTAVAAADSLGAAPLLALLTDLARRARLSAVRRTRVAADPAQPTQRELDVLRLVAEGLTNREIAARLFLSPKTVGIHVSRLLRKLDAHTRGEAVAVARRRGLLA